MKTSKQTKEHHPVLINRLISILIIAALCIGESCTEAEIKEYEAGDPCFTRESLETVPWIKDQLAWFQVPNSGYLRVAVYLYRDQYFLVFENMTVSAPLYYVFNCDGKGARELDLHYDEFYNNIKLVAILLEDKY